MGKIYIDDDLKVAIYYSDEIKKIIDYENSKISSIYRGRVKKVSRTMNCAFVDIGLEKDGYLDLSNIREDINETDEILVQIKKVPEREKSEKLTMELSFSGKYIVYFPERKFIKFSKLLGKKEKDELLKFAKEKNIKGVLFRSNARTKYTQNIVGEYLSLKKTADKILLEKNLRPTPKELYFDNSLKSFIRDNYKKEDIIISNSKDLFTDEENYEVEYDKGFKLIYNKQLLEAYKSLFNKKIELFGGANIVIEKTESLYAIDVNSSNYSVGSTVEENNYKVNELAAIEVVRQIKLRNLSGIIIIDFINMNDFNNREKLLKLLKKSLSKDDSRSEVYGFTGLGLVEIGRKNLGSELKNKLGK